MIVVLSVIYILIWIFNYKFMFTYFKRDQLSDKAFKYHVLFLSAIWPMFWILWITLIIIAPIIIFPIVYFIYLILFPIQTYKETKEAIKNTRFFKGK